MLNLQDDHPKWIMRECIAHGLNLLMKGFCKYKRASGPNSWDRTWGLKWAENNVNDSNTVPNFLQDSETTRKALGDAQKSLCKGRRSSITVSVPTSWASNFFVVKSVMQNRTALQMVVGSEKWAELSATSKRDDVRDICLSADFSKHGERLVELLQPFSDAIHQLEGDKPRLADCLIVPRQLQSHGRHGQTSIAQMLWPHKVVAKSQAVLYPRSVDAWRAS
jgi:hypothetical protein